MKEPLTDNPSVLQKFNYIFSGRQRRNMVLLCGILVVGALLETGTTALMLPFMNTVIRPETIGESSYRQIIARIFGVEGTTAFLVLMSLLLAATYLFKAAFNLFSIRIQQRFVANVQTNLSARLFDCFMEKSYAYHLRHGIPEISQGLNDVGQLMTLIQNVLSLLSELLVSLFMLTMLLLVDPMLTAVAAILIMTSLLLTNRMVIAHIRRTGELVREYSILQGRAFWQGLGGLKGIKVNRNEQLFINRYAENNRLACDAGRRYTVLSSIPRLTVEAVSMSGIFLFMAYLTNKGMNLDQMLPLFATFALAAVRLMPCANRLVAAYNSINYNRVALNKVYENLRESGVDMQSRVQVVKPVPPREKTQPLREGVRVENVRFRYEEAAEDLFDGASLHIPAQQSTAFVGVTGSGKTTMADLILGLHTPNDGRITADGHDIHQEPAWWAARVGYVPQSIYLCDDTVAGNVAFGQELSDIDEARVWECLDQAQMKEFVESLPKGLQTMVGDNGIRLSGGQRQRIGIARALYLDPQLLVLDEATSSLDNDTEQAIIDAVNKLAGHKTLLIIAHRLTTIQNCNVIYRVEHGTVTRER